MKMIICLIFGHRWKIYSCGAVCLRCDKKDEWV